MSRYSRHNPDEPVSHDWYAGATPPPKTMTDPTPATTCCAAPDHIEHGDSGAVSVSEGN